MTAAEIRNAVDALKPLCDPRGHALLDSIAEAWLLHVQAVDDLGRLIDSALDNTDHSKQAHLRSVPDIVAGGGRSV